MSSLHDSPRGGRSNFHQVVAGFLLQPGLPFASILSAERIERIFAKHGNLFGRDAIYSTAARNKVPTGVIGEAIMYLSRGHDLNAFASQPIPGLVAA